MLATKEEAEDMSFPSPGLQDSKKRKKGKK
jgi:hypothetical protein